MFTFIFILNETQNSCKIPNKKFVLIGEKSINRRMPNKINRDKCIKKQLNGRNRLKTDKKVNKDFDIEKKCQSCQR